MKQVIRQNIREQRNELDSAWTEAMSNEICKRIHSLEVFEKAEMIGIYLALPGEVQLDALTDHCRKLGKRICVPVFDDYSKVCVMAEWHANTELVAGKWDVLEPSEHRRVDDDEIDMMLVPGVAFDTNGERLGRGGGYYDRMLEKSDAYHVGVAFQFQIVQALATEEHDMPMELVVTEQHFYGRNAKHK
ncbi:5-formyltetrahydrofolate cyclo-ligase [Verrucomicrobiota bacterium]